MTLMVLREYIDTNSKIGKMAWPNRGELLLRQSYESAPGGGKRKVYFVFGIKVSEKKNGGLINYTCNVIPKNLKKNCKAFLRGALDRGGLVKISIDKPSLFEKYGPRGIY